MNHPIQFIRTSVFKPNECEGIINLLDDLTSNTAEVMDTPGKSWARRCDISWVPRSADTADIYNPIEQSFNDAAHFFGFQIDRIQELQYTIYTPFDFYRMHTDNGHNEPGVLKRKLTMSINLSGPNTYLGGRLKVKTQSRAKTTKVEGQATIFPSFLWHQANPVWFGKRKAIVAWALGQEPFR